MKKTKKIIIWVLVALTVIMLVPVKMRLKDGGSTEYNAILYKVTDLHRLPRDPENEDFIEGIIIEILGKKVYEKIY